MANFNQTCHCRNGENMKEKMQNIKRMLTIALMCISLTVMLSSASDFVLRIYGNANMDDTIDDTDLKYIEGIINGANEKTKFADANYDQKIDQEDYIQIQKIINGTEKKLTFSDIFGEAETVNKPIKRLANIGFYSLEITKVLDATDILLPVVGYDRSNQPVFYPEFSKWQVVGYTPDDCDYEKILSLNPDAVMTNLEARWSMTTGLKDKAAFKEKFPGIPIICLNMREIDVLPEMVMTYGYIIDREGEARRFVNWFEGYKNTFESMTKGLAKEDRPTVYYEGGTPYKTKNSTDRYAQAIILAGGDNIADNIPDAPVMFDVDPEFIVKQNPKFIIICAPSWDITASYETDDISNLSQYRTEMMNRSVLSNVDAIKNNRVYVLDGNIFEGAGRNVIGIAYIGKLLHPDLFKDIDPQAIQQEYTSEIWNLDFDVSSHGAFTYPPYNTWPKAS